MRKVWQKYDVISLLKVKLKEYVYAGVWKKYFSIIHKNLNMVFTYI